MITREEARIFRETYKLEKRKVLKEIYRRIFKRVLTCNYLEYTYPGKDDKTISLIEKHFTGLGYTVASHGNIWDDNTYFTISW